MLLSHPCDSSGRPVLTFHEVQELLRAFSTMTDAELDAKAREIEERQDLDQLRRLTSASPD